VTTPPSDAASARELLESSEKLRGDLLTAVLKLDAYIEQLRDAMPQESADGQPAS
jgi:hypothetical protein